MSEASVAVTPSRGTVGNTRSIGLSILWAILTLGIYCLVLGVQDAGGDEAVLRRGRRRLARPRDLPRHRAGTWFLVPSEVGKLYSRDGQQPPVTGITGLWLLLPLVGAFVWFIKVQGALNRFWISKGAPA